MTGAMASKVSRFLPTPSARRATRSARQVRQVRRISTHALREEGDLPEDRRFIFDLEFLPTPSARRATSERSSGWKTTAVFLPTPSARRAKQIRRKPHPIYRQHDGLKGKIHKSLF